ncbi:hypothetical protein BU17DRAFT_85671 [Hysterangium stoloniferum]|nr:hypothetical protein BU17DRAFT_85671 [Hysterangium stoloniferum]
MAHEKAAQACWKAIASGELVDDFDKLNPNDYTELHEEELYWCICKERFETECEAYSHLSSLQGVTILCFYRAVMVSSPDVTPRNVAEAFVYGIIIEKIDAIPLSSVDPSSHKFPSLGHSLMAAVYSFSSHSIIHNNMCSDNILISPKHLITINFGQAILRGDNEDDECGLNE